MEVWNFVKLWNLVFNLFYMRVSTGIKSLLIIVVLSFWYRFTFIFMQRGLKLTDH